MSLASSGLISLDARPNSVGARRQLSSASISSQLVSGGDVRPAATSCCERDETPCATTITP